MKTEKRTLTGASKKALEESGFEAKFKKNCPNLEYTFAGVSRRGRMEIDFTLTGKASELEAGFSFIASRAPELQRIESCRIARRNQVRLQLEAILLLYDAR